MTTTAYRKRAIVTVPDGVAKNLRLKPGDMVVVSARAQAAPADMPEDSFSAMMRRARSMGFVIPAGYKFKRSDAYDED